MTPAQRLSQLLLATLEEENPCQTEALAAVGGLYTLVLVAVVRDPALRRKRFAQFIEIVDEVLAQTEVPAGTTIQ
jgi:hypothetical protein